MLKESRDFSEIVPGITVPPSVRYSYEFGPFRLEPEPGLLLRNGELLSLTPKVLALLLVLVKNRGRVVPKDDLMQTVWPDTVVEESNLSHNIAVLRKVLGEASGKCRYIETLPKRGYRFIADVRVVPESATPAGRETALAIGPTERALSAKRVWPVLICTLLVTAGGLLAWLALSRARMTPLQPRFSQLTDQTGQEAFPSLSPDGKSVVYASRATGNWDIYLQRMGGRNTVNLTSNSPADDIQPSFSPDGERIAFHGRSQWGLPFDLHQHAGFALRINLAAATIWARISGL